MDEEFQKPNLTSDQLERLACAINPYNDWDNIIPYVKQELVEELNEYGDFNNLKDENIKESDIRNIFDEKKRNIKDDKIKDDIDFLLAEYINLIKLVDTATEYLSVKGLLYRPCTEPKPIKLKKQFLDEYLYEYIAENYQREIDKVKEQPRKQKEERRKQKEERRKQKEEQLKQQLREEQRINKDENSVYNPMLNGGRRSTQKRKKTIRKKRKNKKRTRRFR
jgi:hypothetical protein